jgi:hypothetical protein
MSCLDPSQALRRGVPNSPAAAIELHQLFPSSDVGPLRTIVPGLIGLSSLLPKGNHISQPRSVEDVVVGEVMRSHVVAWPGLRQSIVGLLVKGFRP